MTCTKKNSAIESLDEFGYLKVPTRQNSDSSSYGNFFDDFTSLNEDCHFFKGSNLVDVNIEFRSTDSMPSYETLQTSTEPVSIPIESSISEARTSPVFYVEKQKKSIPNKVPKIQPNKVRKAKSEIDKIKSKKEPKTVDSKKQIKEFKCKFCEMSFEKSVSLGGHLSKAHPGSSKPYNYKMKVRIEREEQRKYLQLAKEWYYENISSKVKSRQHITNIKKALM